MVWCGTWLGTDVWDCFRCRVWPPIPCYGTKHTPHALSSTYADTYTAVEVALALVQWWEHCHQRPVLSPPTVPGPLTILVAAHAASQVQQYVAHKSITPPPKLDINHSIGPTHSWRIRNNFIKSPCKRSADGYLNTCMLPPESIPLAASSLHRLNNLRATTASPDMLLL